MNIDEMEKEIEELDVLLEEELKDIKTYLNEKGMNYKSNKRTVCQVFRDIHQKTDNDEVKKLTVEGTLMAKKMAKKLAEYSKKFGGSLADKHLIEIIKLRDSGVKLNKGQKSYLKKIEDESLNKTANEEILEAIKLRDAGEKLNKTQTDILKKVGLYNV